MFLCILRKPITFLSENTRPSRTCGKNSLPQRTKGKKKSRPLKGKQENFDVDFIVKIADLLILEYIVIAPDLEASDSCNFEVQLT